MITVNGHRQVEWRSGLTVADLLAALGWDYALITTTVDGRYLPPEDYAHCELADGADVRAIHIAHGG